MAEPYPDAIPVDDFVTWTDWVLSRFGFRPSNVLPLLSVCRDELMLPLVDAVHGTWGPSFDASSLAGLPFLGRTGLAAALGHAPGEDGRHRFVLFVLPHVGVDGEGGVGVVRRPGVRRDTAACGALVVISEELAAPGPAGEDDPDDLEMGLLRAHVAARLVDVPVPGLPVLTDLVRREAVAVLDRLVAELGTPAAPVDHAVFSGVLVHRPDGVDEVAPREAFVTIDHHRVRLLA
jgi:hypothetical protein